MNISSSEAMINMALSYLYGAVSALSSQLSYERNAYGELVCFRAGEAETNASFTSEHQYDSLGFELERLLPGGVSQSFAYDNIGRLVDSKTRRSAEQRRSRHYNWGSADRLLSIEDDRTHSV